MHLPTKNNKIIDFVFDVTFDHPLNKEIKKVDLYRYTFKISFEMSKKVLVLVLISIKGILDVLLLKGSKFTKAWERFSK